MTSEVIFSPWHEIFINENFSLYVGNGEKNSLKTVMLTIVDKCRDAVLSVTNLYPMWLTHI